MIETRKQFHEELDELRRAVIHVAALVTDSIPRVTAALLSGDLEEAQKLIERDDEVDHASLANEEQAIRLMALQQPMASDLRRVVTALKLNGEIERSADLATNIAKATRRIHGATITPPLRGLIEAMSAEASKLFRLAVDAYADDDAGLAAALDDLDDRLDALNHEFVEAILATNAEDDLELQPAVQLALIARYYERIGDHAVNIGNQVQYMVTGWLPEHAGAARVEARRAEQRQKR